jgi:hypothetical protein
MTSFRSELAAAGKTIDVEKMISYITASLDGTYNALFERVDNTPGISLDDVMNQISAYDIHQTLFIDTNTNAKPFMSSANLSSRPLGSSPNRDCGADRSHDEGRRDEHDRCHEDMRHDDDRLCDGGSQGGADVETVPTPPLLIYDVRFTKYMVTLLVTIGGTTMMTLMTVTAMIRLPMLSPIALTQTATLIRVLDHITEAPNKLSTHDKY